MPEAPPPIASRRFRVEAHGDALVLRVRPFDRLAVWRCVLLLFQVAVVASLIVPLLLPEPGLRLFEAACFTVASVGLLTATPVWVDRVAAFTGDVVSTVQRTLMIRTLPPVEAGYREVAAPGTRTLLVDARVIARERLRCVGVARVEPQAGVGMTRRFFSVTVVLDDGMIRVERFSNDADARRFALSLASALDIACDPGELPEELRQASSFTLRTIIEVLTQAGCVLAGILLLLEPGPTVWQAAGVGAAVLGVDAMARIFLPRSVRTQVAEDMRRRRV